MTRLLFCPSICILGNLIKADVNNSAYGQSAIIAILLLPLYLGDLQYIPCKYCSSLINLYSTMRTLEYAGIGTSHH